MALRVLSRQYAIKKDPCGSRDIESALGRGAVGPHECQGEGHSYLVCEARRLKHGLPDPVAHGLERPSSTNYDDHGMLVEQGKRRTVTEVIARMALPSGPPGDAYNFGVYTGGGLKALVDGFAHEQRADWAHLGI